MKIKSIHVKNLRCLRDVFLPCDDLTVMVGRNGVGKSCLLKALNLFYNAEARVDEQDWYANNTDEEISIALRFFDLTESERKLFAPYLEGEELTIEKVCTYGVARPKYYGNRYKNPEFEAFRAARGTNLRIEYNRLKTKPEFEALPPYQNMELAEKALQEWELSNTDKCELQRDDGQFFGFQNVGRHRMEKYTKFILVPAVQEASEEAVERKGSMFEEVMEIVVKSTLASNEELARLEAEAEKRYRQIVDPSRNEDLKNLEKRLTSTLNYYVPDSEVDIQWIEEAGIAVNVPRAYVTLNEGGFFNTVDRCGHGLQRAYILSLFQELALIQASASLEREVEQSGERSLPSLIIGIEEPELYQHPDRVRHFANTLLQLSRGGLKGAIASIQVVYSTHSPLMVDFQRFNQLRVFKKSEPAELGKPRETSVKHTDLFTVSRFVERAKGESCGSISDEGLRHRLIPLMNPWMNEGFFANLAVLVEGIRDRALILGMALSENLDFESKGICVIPCSGKDSMTEAIAIFKCLEIPTYVVWDSDEGNRKGIPANRNILRCHDCEPENYPCNLTDDFCCTRTDLEETFRHELGEDNYNRILMKYCQDRDLGRPKYAMENPYVVSELISLFLDEGYQSETLSSTTRRIMMKYDALQGS